jgi:hypothetical protein
MIKDVHINNPNSPSQEDGIPCREGPFTDGFRENEYFVCGCGLRSSAGRDCAMLTILGHQDPQRTTTQPAKPLLNVVVFVDGLAEP